MKEIRLCDNADIDLTTNLCIENNLGIEIQAFHDPYCDKDKLLIDFSPLTLLIISQIIFHFKGVFKDFALKKK